MVGLESSLGEGGGDGSTLDSLYLFTRAESASLMALLCYAFSTIRFSFNYSGTQSTAF